MVVRVFENLGKQIKVLSHVFYVPEQKIINAMGQAINNCKNMYSKILTHPASKILAVLLSFTVLLANPAFCDNGQNGQNEQNEPVIAAAGTELTASIQNNSNLASPTIGNVVLKAGTPIILRTVNAINSKMMTFGSVIPFEVAEDVVADGVVVILAGTPVKGEVVAFRNRIIFGGAAKMTIAVSQVNTIDNKTANVEGSQQFKGQSNSGIAWACFVVSLIILWPLILVPFFVKGKDVEISSGAIFNCTVSNDVMVAVPAVSSR